MEWDEKERERVCVCVGGWSVKFTGIEWQHYSERQSVYSSSNKSNMLIIQPDHV